MTVQHSLLMTARHSRRVTATHARRRKQPEWFWPMPPEPQGGTRSRKQNGVKVTATVSVDENQTSASPQSAAVFHHPRERHGTPTMDSRRRGCLSRETTHHCIQWCTCSACCACRLIRMTDLTPAYLMPRDLCYSKSDMYARPSLRHHRLPRARTRCMAPRHGVRRQVLLATQTGTLAARHGRHGGPHAGPPHACTVSWSADA